MAMTTHGFRIKEEDLANFRSKCETIARSPNDMLRELIVSFTEERIVIKPTPEQKQERKIYHESGE